MKKFILSIITTLCLATSVFAQEITDKNITQTPEFYRQQIVLIQKYSKTNFMNAVIQGDTKLIEAYIKSGMSPNTKGMNIPAIMFAVSAHNHDVIQLLADYGADMNIKSLGITPLILAINKKCYDCAKTIINNGADINLAFKEFSPLYEALCKKQYDTAKLLVEKGAEINDDIIIKAVKSDNEEIKALILKASTKNVN